MSTTIPSTEFGPLLPQHEALIRESAINSDVANERVYRSVITKVELERLGFGRKQQQIPGLLVPVRDVHGKIATHQLRPDAPRTKDGKPLKYETPQGSSMVLDVPNRARDLLDDPRVPLYITEGARKADAGVSAGLCTVALLGVWNWRGTNGKGGKTALPDWESVALNDRRVYLVFDSDVTTKPAVHGALVRLRAFLEKRGAKVKVVYLPDGPDDQKLGLDDYLALGHGPETLLELASSELKSAPDTSVFDDYFERDGCTYWNKPAEGGVVPRLLANFTATITKDLILDDGVECQNVFEIQAVIGTHKRTLFIPAREFGSMFWVPNHLGARAIVEPGFSIKDHLRVAIQKLSGDIEQESVFAHLGWNELADGTSIYIHAGGAIGPNGPVGGVRVELPAGLEGLELGQPKNESELRADLRTALDVLRAAPLRVTVPVLASVFRAVFGEVPFSLFLHGSTGSHKSCVAALAQGFWMPSATYDNLPTGWSSTANFNEQLAFCAKDSLLVVDDFVASGSPGDVGRLNREADRLLRAQGNRVGRGRMRADSGLRQGRAPRGMILSTGEDLPAGESLRARMLTLEVKAGDVDLVRLTELQDAAKQGCLARTMGAFVKFAAGRLVPLRARIHDRALELRDEFRGRLGHTRLPSTFGDLMAALEVFLTYCMEMGVLDREAVLALSRDCRDALLQALQDQGEDLAAAEPAGQFLRLLASALSSCSAHISSINGDAPDAPLCSNLGWLHRPENGSWEPRGPRVGWIEGDDLFLDLSSALKAANSIAPDGERVSRTSRSVGRLLKERGYLVSTDDTRGRHKVRRCIGGERRDVLHLRLSSLQDQSQASPPSPGATHPNRQETDSAVRDANDGDGTEVQWSNPGPAECPPPSDIKANTMASGNSRDTRDSLYGKPNCQLEYEH